MPDTWLTLDGQTDLLRQLALRRDETTDAQELLQLRTAREYAALVELASSESGQIFLNTLVRGVLLRPCQNDVDRGRQHLALEILENMRHALAQRKVSQERLHYEFPAGGVSGSAAGQ